MQDFLEKGASNPEEGYRPSIWHCLLKTAYWTEKVASIAPSSPCIAYCEVLGNLEKRFGAPYGLHQTVEKVASNFHGYVSV